MLKFQTILATCLFFIFNPANAQMEFQRSFYNYGLGRWDHETIHWHFSKKQLAKIESRRQRGIGKNYLLRTELGACYTFTSGTVTQTFHQTDENTHTTLFDISFKGPIKSKSGVLLSFNSGQPFMKFGDNAVLIFTYGLSVHDIDWTRKDLRINKTDLEYKVSSWGYGVSLGFDYKSGSDAILSWYRKGCFTFGFGMEPYIQTGSWYNANFVDDVKVYPFLKIEFGIATKAALLKLRLIDYFGQFHYFNTEQYSSGGGTQTTYMDITGSNQLAIGLIFNLSTSAWGREDWYKHLPY